MGDVCRGTGIPLHVISLQNQKTFSDFAPIVSTLCRHDVRERRCRSLVYFLKYRFPAGLQYRILTERLRFPSSSVSTEATVTS